MTVSLTHAKEATLPDDPNYEVGSTEWNEQHVLTQDTARLLGRTTAGTGPTEEITVGSGLSLAGGELTATGGGTGTVTSVSVVSANGLAGTVATDTTTPAITLSTSVTGVLKGNGTAISAATPSVDYTVPADLAAYLTTAAAAAAYQPLDPDLTSIAGLGGNGFPARTAANTYTMRSLAGTASRISVTNPAGVAGNPTLDIDAAYVGQTSITTLGTIGTGVWNGTVVIGTYGGTGVNNSTRTMTYAGNVAFTGAFNPTFASSASVTHTLPGVAGTLATLAGTETFTNKTLTAPTMTAPVLGTPSSGTLTNCTGLPIGGTTGYGTGVATALAVNVGSAGAPVLLNGAGGTPSAIVLTNASGSPTLTTVTADTFVASSSNTNAQTGTTYTVQSSDNGKVILCTNGSAIAVSLNTGLSAGFACTIIQGGAGQVTVGGTATTNAANGKKTRAQYSAISIIYFGASNTYVIAGDTAV